MKKVFEATLVLDGVFDSEDEARQNLATHLAAGGIHVDPQSINIVTIGPADAAE